MLGLETISFFVILAIINATIPGQSIPIEVTPRLVDEQTSTTTTTTTGGGGAATPATPVATGLDIATITGVIGVGIAMWQGYQKNASRTNATADTSLNLAQSLKATDKGTADTANILSSALSKLSSVNPEIAQALETCKPAAVQNAKEWNKDLKQYYENEPVIKSEDIGLDKVKTKLREVNKITLPTPDGAATTTTTATTDDGGD